MRKLLFMITIILESCMSTQPNYFLSLGINDIKDYKGNIRYSEHYEDEHFFDVGTIADPQIEFSIKYDTAKQYKALLLGAVIFHTDTNSFQKDSICIRKLILSGKNVRRRIYDSEHPINYDSCNIPKSILYSIREDFFIRMKETKFNFHTRCKGYIYSHNYQLY